MTKDVFDTPGTTEDNQAPASYLEALVGEGKKFSDHEALAKGKWEADSYAKRIENENRTLRKELDTRLSYEEFLDQIKTQKATTPKDDNQDLEDVVSHKGDKASVSKEEIMNLVKESINQDRTESAKRNNRLSCVSELEKAWGSNYVDKLNTRADELGVTKEFLNEIAASAPKAFVKMVLGDTEKPRGNPNAHAAPRSSATPPNGGSGQKDWAYYEAIRKSDLRRYLSPQIQNEMTRRAVAGELEIPS